MIVVRFPAEYAPQGMAKSRRFSAPLDEEWQADGTWTGLFDIERNEQEAFYGLIENVSEGTVETKEIESRDDIPNHRMTFLFTTDQMAVELANQRRQARQAADE